MGKLLDLPFAKLAPLVGRTRLFGPGGIAFLAQVTPVVPDDPDELGRRLSGTALVRFFSSALRRDPPTGLPDILGCAIRFGWDESRLRRPDGGARARDGDQDLLFLAFTRDGCELTANDYHAVIPFQVRGGGRIKLRLVPLSRGGEGRDRDARLRDLLARSPSGSVELRLDLRPTGRPRSWRPAAVIALQREVRLERGAPKFSPFLDGAGVSPAGLARGVQRASQAVGHRVRALRERQEKRRKTV